MVEKPPGMLVHPVTAVAGGTLADWVREVVAGPVHLLGRLDRDTSGVVVVAREAATRRALDRALARGAVRRRYLALAAGHPQPAEGVIDAPIGRSLADPPLRAVTADGAPARTRYRTLERLRDAALVELELETGRTHQIRVHLAHLGHPVLGDRWYGRVGLELIGRQALHAYRVSLTHPASREPLVVEAPLPEDMMTLYRRLGGESRTGR